MHSDQPLNTRLLPYQLSTGDSKQSSTPASNQQHLRGRLVYSLLTPIFTGGLGYSVYSLATQPFSILAGIGAGLGGLGGLVSGWRLYSNCSTKRVRDGVDDERTLKLIAEIYRKILGLTTRLNSDPRATTFQNSLVLDERLETINSMLERLQEDVDSLIKELKEKCSENGIFQGQINELDERCQSLMEILQTKAVDSSTEETPVKRGNTQLLQELAALQAAAASLYPSDAETMSRSSSVKGSPYSPQKPRQPLVDRNSINVV